MDSMSGDQPYPELRFNVGRHEKSAVMVIMTLEFILVGALVLIGSGWFYFTAGAYWDPKASVLDTIEAVPIIIGIGAAIFLLTCLHE